MGARLDDGLGRVVDESRPTEAGIPLAAVGVEDPELGPATRWAITVPGDHHPRPLADDVPAETDPVTPVELNPKRRRFGDGAGE
jgi:hypothetical protein